MKRINDTWRQWLSRLLFGTKWTTVCEAYRCLSCDGWSLRDRPVAVNDAAATNLTLLRWVEAPVRCPYCKSKFVVWKEARDA